MLVKVGKDGLVEIPAEVRQSLGLAPGTYYKILQRGQDMVLQRLEDAHVRCLTLEMGADTIHSASSTQHE